MEKKKFRVVALGGCGGVGRFATQTALKFDNVAEIVIADYNEEQGRIFAQECGAKATFAKVDVTDPLSLEPVFKNADAVISTAGPYYKFGTPVLDAAIRARCHYLDINDDWEPTLEMLELGRKAEKAGVTAIIGMGASPGISNLLAVKAISQLDTVEDLTTGWGKGVGFDPNTSAAKKNAKGGRAAYEHWFHQLTGSIRTVKAGCLADTAPIEKVIVDYPGLGPRNTYTVGHPEPVTLFRRYPNLKNSCNVMSIPHFVIEILRWLAEKVNVGEITIPEAVEFLIEIQSSDTLPDELMERFSKIAFGSTPKPHLPTIFAHASGKKDGKNESVGVALKSFPTGGIGGMTGVPMAVCLDMLFRGMITQTGVFTPEEVVDPDLFFERLAPYCAIDPKVAGGSSLNDRGIVCIDKSSE